MDIFFSMERKLKTRTNIFIFDQFNSLWYKDKIIDSSGGSSYFELIKNARFCFVRKYIVVVEESRLGG